MLEELQRKVESVEMKLKEKESCVAEVRMYMYVCVTAIYALKTHSKYMFMKLHVIAFGPVTSTFYHTHEPQENSLLL